jgi:alpha-amylase
MLRMTGFRAPILAALLLAFGAALAAEPAKDSKWGAENEVFYKIFVRSFADSNGDRIGDFKGIEEHLTYLQDLGVTSLLLTPIVPSKYYHNYFASRFDGVDSDFGDLASFHHLVRALHGRGMKIYLDEEIQYVSQEHPWWLQSAGHPESQYGQYLVYDGPRNTDPNPGLGAFRTYDGMNARLAMVNLQLPAVHRYFESLFAWWLDPEHNGDFAAGVDGFRIDHMMDDLDHKGKLTNLVAGFWAPLIAHARAVNPKIAIIAEQADWRQYGDDLQRRGDVDLVYAFPLRAALVGLDGNSIAAALTEMLAKTGPGKGQLIFLENHDTNRFASEVMRDARKERLGAALNVLLKGSPLLYYGQELGMLGRQFKDSGTDGNDIPVREAFRWTRSVESPGSAVWYRKAGIWWDNRYARDGDGISVEEEQGNPDSLLEYYRRLLALRRSRPDLREGTQTIAVSHPQPVLAIRRGIGDIESLIVCNFAASAQSAVIDAQPPLPGRANDGALQDLLTGKIAATAHAGRIRIDLPPYGVAVLAAQAR